MDITKLEADAGRFFIRAHTNRPNLQYLNKAPLVEIRGRLIGYNLLTGACEGFDALQSTN